MTESIIITVGPEEAARRVDQVVTDHLPGSSRAEVQFLARAGKIRRAGVALKPAQRVADGDLLEIELIERPGLSAAPQEIPLEIVYQDSDLAVVDKPAGLVVHPSAGHPDGTLANALVARFPQAGSVGDTDRPGIVHRLDKDTSGLMVVALNRRAHSSLQAQIAAHSAGRVYLALTAGHPVPASGTVDAPIGRDPRDRKRMAAHGVAARPARTVYRVEEYLPGFALVECTLQTGRTHQIRVHMAATGHPIAGDTVYSGPPLSGLSRQFLHAYRLSLRSPSTGELLTFASPLPLELQGVLDGLRDRPR